MKSRRHHRLWISTGIFLLLLIGFSFTLRRRRLLRRDQPERKLDHVATTTTRMTMKWWNWRDRRNSSDRNKHYPESGHLRNCSDWKDTNNNRYNNDNNDYYVLMDPCHDDDDDDEDDEAKDENTSATTTTIVTTEPGEGGGGEGGDANATRSGPWTTEPEPEPALPALPPTPVDNATTYYDDDDKDDNYVEEEEQEEEADSSTSSPTGTMEDGVAPVMSESEDDAEDYDDFVYATVYVRLKPNQTSIEPVVTTTCTRLLNETLALDDNENENDIVLYLPSRPERRQEHFLLRRRRNLQLQLVQPPNPLGNYSFSLVHVDTESNLVVRQSQEHGDDCDCWWWEYQLQYACFYQHNASRVMDPFMLQEISDHVHAALEAITMPTSLVLEEALQNETGNDDIIVVLEQEDIEESSSSPKQREKNGGDIFPVDDNTTMPIDDQPDTGNGDTSNNSTGGSGPTYSQPLNANEWDWRRYFGLALFLGTFSVSLIYMDLQYHHHRHHHRRRPGRHGRKSSKVDVCWANLASEEGVSELLKTGWKVQQGGGGTTATSSSNNKSRRFLEIYDKSKWGYADDDSMLMGGYQQHEPTTNHHHHHHHDVDATTPESVTQTTYEPTMTQPPSPTSPSRSPVAMSSNDHHHHHNVSSSNGNNNSPEAGVVIRTVVTAYEDLPPPPPLTMPPPPS